MTSAERSALREYCDSCCGKDRTRKSDHCESFGCRTVVALLNALDQSERNLAECQAVLAEQKDVIEDLDQQIDQVHRALERIGLPITTPAAEALGKPLIDVGEAVEQVVRELVDLRRER